MLPQNERGAGVAVAADEPDAVMDGVRDIVAVILADGVMLLVIDILAVVLGDVEGDNVNDAVILAELDSLDEIVLVIVIDIEAVFVEERVADLVTVTDCVTDTVIVAAPVLDEEAVMDKDAETDRDDVGVPLNEAVCDADGVAEPVGEIVELIVVVTLIVDVMEGVKLDVTGKELVGDTHGVAVVLALGVTVTELLALGVSVIEPVSEGLVVPVNDDVKVAVAVAVTLVVRLVDALVVPVAVTDVVKD